MAQPIASNKNYGYFYVTDVTAQEDGTIIENESNAFTFTESGNGFTITQADDRFIYLTGTFASFQIGAEVPEADAAATVWTVAAQEDGTVKITNASLGKWIQYSSNYTSYGAYNSDQDGGYRPVLYEKIEK